MDEQYFLDIITSLRSRIQKLEEELNKKNSMEWKLFNKYNLALPKAIHETRKQLGLTQQEMADFIGISLRTAQRWESGEGEVKGVHKKLKLAKLLLNKFTLEETSNLTGLPKNTIHVRSNYDLDN